MVNGLKRYNVFLYDNVQHKQSDCLLETENLSEAKYLMTEPGHLIDDDIIVQYNEVEIYDNEIQDDVYNYISY